jgi:signal transduction histidine kinase/DNA-binding response OmpR family regulator
MKQPFKFGIREQTVALVLVLSALQVTAVGWYLFRANKRIVVQHELVDLGDEAELRAWEIIDQIDVLKEDLRTLALDPKIHAALMDAPQNAKRLSGLVNSKCREWDGYCSVKVSPLEIAPDNEIQLETPRVAKLRDERGVREQLLREIVGVPKGSHVLLSRIVREEAEITQNGPEGQLETASQWLPVIWGAVRVDLDRARPDGNSAFKIVIGLSLDSRRWSADPRHLAFLIDGPQAPGLSSDVEVTGPQGYLIHPQMDTPAQFGDDVFAWQRSEDDASKSLVEEIRSQESSGEVTALGDPGRRSIRPVRRIALVQEVGLQPEFHRYYREGVGTDLFYDQRAALGEWHEEATRDVEKPFENVFNWRMRSLGDEYRPRGLRMGGMTGQVRSSLRILGTTEDSVREMSDQLVRDLNERLALRVMEREEGTVFPKGTSDPGGAGLDPNADTVRWNRIIPCRTADLVCVRVRIDGTAATHSDDGQEPVAGSERKNDYWFLYAVFHEELAASVDAELWPAIRGAGFGMIAAGMVAALVAILSVRPLIRLIKGARQSAELKGEGLHANIRKMAMELPVKRQDEVGDIARALRKLFETMDKNAELEAAAEEKNRFLASVSHELRTPLTIVAGNLQLLLRTDLSDKEKNYANKALDASKRLQALIRDLLDIQKIIMGGMSLEATNFDVPELLADIQESMQPQAEKNGNRLTVEAEGLGHVSSDRVRLNQILTNLVSNSCNFTEDGDISVQAGAYSQEGSNWMRFVVKDSGRGMSDEEQLKVFTRFYTNKKANVSGTGLGLDICRSLGELMGGRVFLKESSLGNGSTFVVELPQTILVPERDGKSSIAGVLDSVDSEVASRHSSKSNSNASGLPTVLVIDDEPGIQHIMKEHLEGHYRVLTAGNGKAGLEMAIKEHPQLITLDVMMDDIDGWEVLRTLRANPETASIPVVMVTILENQNRGIELGADDYVTKPVDWDRMFSVIGGLTSCGDNRQALIVDDDTETRQLFRSVLTRNGWRVVEANHGAAALKKIEADKPGVIVLDLMMPEMDGFEFLQELHRNPDWGEIPVIVVTAKHVTRSEQKILDESAARVIRKGTQTVGELLEEVQNYENCGRQADPPKTP